MAVSLRAIDFAILLHCGYYSSVFPLMGLIGHHSCHVNPFYYFIPWVSSAHLLLLYIFLLSWACCWITWTSLPSPFTLSLPLITLMGLLAIIHVMSTHFTTLFFGFPRPHLVLLYLFLLLWAYYFIPWASSAYLFFLYLLLFSWAYWLSILPLQPTGLVSLFLYRFAPYFLLIFFIVGLFLLSGPLSKWASATCTMHVKIQKKNCI